MSHARGGRRRRWRRRRGAIVATVSVGLRTAAYSAACKQRTHHAHHGLFPSRGAASSPGGRGRRREKGQLGRNPAPSLAPSLTVNVSSHSLYPLTVSTHRTHALCPPFLLAAQVANVVPSHIRRGGSATDLRSELLRHPYTHFLFSGHGDAELGPSGASGEGASRTLGFTSPNGGLETVTPETLADVLGAHSPRCGGCLSTVVLNGCQTSHMGERVRAAGVTFVLCWRTKAENTAARLLACSFFASLAAGRGHHQAFEDAKAAVRCVTRPGRLANGVQSSVPAYELRDPLDGGLLPQIQQQPSSPGSTDGSNDAIASGTATHREGGGPVRRGFSPPPMAAGIPLLLCADDTAARV